MYVHKERVGREWGRLPMRRTIEGFLRRFVHSNGAGVISG